MTNLLFFAAGMVSVPAGLYVAAWIGDWFFDKSYGFRCNDCGYELLPKQTKIYRRVAQKRHARMHKRGGGND